MIMRFMGIFLRYRYEGWSAALVTAFEAVGLQIGKLALDPDDHRHCRA
jgi:hypothetical protein